MKFKAVGFSFWSSWRPRMNTDKRIECVVHPLIRFYLLPSVFFPILYSTLAKIKAASFLPLEVGDQLHAKKLAAFLWWDKKRQSPVLYSEGGRILDRVLISFGSRRFQCFADLFVQALVRHACFKGDSPM